ncbi:murinoglobulin-2-like [Mustelus asterias]
MPEPMQGSYRIEVLKKQGKVKHSFTVEEYVLPKYQVTVELPDTINHRDETITVKVCGRYTYGKPVMGEVIGDMSVRNSGRFISGMTLIYGQSMFCWTLFL